MDARVVNKISRNAKIMMKMRRGYLSEMQIFASRNNAENIFF